MLPVVRWCVLHSYAPLPSVVRAPSARIAWLPIRQTCTSEGMDIRVCLGCFPCLGASRACCSWWRACAARRMRAEGACFPHTTRTLDPSTIGVHEHLLSVQKAPRGPLAQSGRRHSRHRCPGGQVHRLSSCSTVTAIRCALEPACSHSPRMAQPNSQHKLHMRPRLECHGSAYRERLYK